MDSEKIQGDDVEMKTTIPEDKLKLNEEAVKRLMKSSEVLQVKNGVIQLDEKNPKHQDWYREEGFGCPF